MDDKSLACYRLGLRLRQAVLTQQHADKSGASGDIDASRHAVARLLSAFADWTRWVGAAVEAQMGRETLNSVAAELAAFAGEGHDIPPSLSLAGRVRAVLSLCQAWAAAQDQTPTGPPAWFRLGVEISAVDYMHPAGKGKTAARWCWHDEAAVNSLLTQLGVPREDVFPAEEVFERGRSASDDSFIDSLPSLPHTPGWAVLECGLKRLSIAPPARTWTGSRQARDQTFLDWHGAEGQDTYHSPTAILRRWNEQYHLDRGSQVSLAVVIKGIQRAKREQETCAPEREATGGQGSGHTTEAEPGISPCYQWPNKARDRWLYKQVCKGTPLKQIVTELNRIADARKWEAMDTEQGVRQAAIKYAERENQPLPPKRRR